MQRESLKQQAWQTCCQKVSAVCGSFCDLGPVLHLLMVWAGVPMCLTHSGDKCTYMVATRRMLPFFILCTTSAQSNHHF